MSPHPKDGRIGKTLNGRYRIVSALAEGAMGTVYRAERMGIGRTVAVKFLRECVAADPQFTKRFEREAMAMSQLAHPNCVPVIDYGVEDGQPYFIMDFAEGKTLADILEDGPLPPRRAIQIIRQVLAALEHAHRQGIIHRDVKPSNVVLTEYPGVVGEQARLLDFGLAAVSRAQSELTQTRIAVGTPTYMSPEQSRGEKVDRRADVYGVGVLLYRMLTGRRPFDAEDTGTMLLLHREAPIPRLDEGKKHRAFSQDLEHVVCKALAKDPMGRYPTALRFSEALSRVPEAFGISTRDQRRARARRVAMISSAALAACLFLVVGLVGESDTPVPPALVAKTAAAPAPVVVRTVEVEIPVVPVMGPEEPLRVDEPEAEMESGLAAAMEEQPLVIEDQPTPDTEGGTLIAATDTPEGPTEDEIVIDDSKDEPAAPTVVDAQALISDGKTKQAIAILESIREEQPKNSQVSYLLGTLYAENGNLSRGVRRYHDAVRKNRRFRRRAKLNRHVIRALGKRKSRKAARRVIIEELGKAAIPHLVRAAKRDPDPTVRRHAARLLKRLRRGT